MYSYYDDGQMNSGAPTSVLQVVVVLLVLHREVGLAPQGPEGQEPRAGARHGGGESGGLQA